MAVSPRWMEEDCVSVCPFRNRWHYDFKHQVVCWPKKIAVILRKDNLKPFRYVRETYGEWKGARVCRTVPKKVNVWQVKGTNKLYVGHLGVWYLAISENNTLKAYNQVPEDTRYFIGRGKLLAKTFKCLKLSNADSPRQVKLKTLNPLYNVPNI